MTLGELLKISSERLQGVSQSASLDAQVLVMHCLGVDRTALIVDESRTLTRSELESITTLIDQRLGGTPVSHLTGVREFWSLPLHVSSSVLIPRPDTEQLVDEALHRIKPGDQIADLGTGSGAVAIAIAHERPDVKLIATDISQTAIDTAASNAQRLGLTNIQFRLGSWLDIFTDERFNMIVSNPPYIAESDPHLHQGDVRFEPRGALIADNDGFADLFEIVDRAPTCLEATGYLLLEHGFQQGARVRERMSERHYQSVLTIEDLGGQERVTLGQIGETLRS